MIKVYFPCTKHVFSFYSHFNYLEPKHETCQYPSFLSHVSSCLIRKQEIQSRDLLLFTNDIFSICWEALQLIFQIRFSFYETGFVQTYFHPDVPDSIFCWNGECPGVIFFYNSFLHNITFTRNLNYYILISLCT